MFGYQEQIEFIEKQISELMVEREKFEAAYQRDIYTLDEFEEKCWISGSDMRPLKSPRRRSSISWNKVN